MSLFTIVTTLLTVSTLATLLWRGRRRYCRPSDHLVTVVGARRLRDGLRRRYWIRCRFCDLDHGPYDDWHTAWLEAFRAQAVTRRRQTTSSGR
jgi:hypothetical protein